MTSPSEAIRLVDVTKRYGEFTAVDAISFDVSSGTVFGLLGPNGAGKTTTIRMIMNIIAPDSGSISVLGRSSREASAQVIGYLPEERGLYRRMKVIDHVAFLGEIKGLSRAVARRRADDWLERFGLIEWRTKKVEELSKGMQQKLQFIGCVIHDPQILILDEPFTGLDPVNARALKDLLLEFRQQGKTLVISTHIMEQAEKLCDEIALINRARIVLHGSLPRIRREYSRNRLTIRGGGSLERLATLEGVDGVWHRNGETEVELADGLAPGEFLRRATMVCDIESAVPHEASLDEIFVRIVDPTALSSSPIEGDS
ncbi:MAG TPA: ATP-binding cassette domain-containing protein [Thermoanaerobaculia bacterium]|nr:ATP-binding cassette domain-containing protein [Thermoanaerobaculia bacterium]